MDVGLGWFRRNNRPPSDRTYVEHLGAGAGFFNAMRIYPHESLGIVVMGNATKYDLDSVLSAVADTYWEQEVLSQAS